MPGLVLLWVASFTWEPLNMRWSSSVTSHFVLNWQPSYIETDNHPEVDLASILRLTWHPSWGWTGACPISPRDHCRWPLQIRSSGWYLDIHKIIGCFRTRIMWQIMYFWKKQDRITFIIPYCICRLLIQNCNRPLERACISLLVYWDKFWNRPWTADWWLLTATVWLTDTLTDMITDTLTDVLYDDWAAYWCSWISHLVG